jgi:hypothetical protein
MSRKATWCLTAQVSASLFLNRGRQEKYQIEEEEKCQGDLNNVYTEFKIVLL